MYRTLPARDGSLSPLPGQGRNRPMSRLGLGETSRGARGSRARNDPSSPRTMSLRRTGSRSLGLAACALLVTACGSTEPKPEARPETELLTSARGAAIELATSRELEEVARLQDARSLGDGRLVQLLAGDRDVRVRIAAATALGRLPYPRFGADV